MLISMTFPQACPAGSHLSSGSACEYCPRGRATTFSSLVTECPACSAGTYSNETGSPFCSSCIAGTFSAVPSICDEFTKEVNVTMEDSWGDGWNSNYLYIGDFMLSLDAYLEDDDYLEDDGSASVHSATATICLPPGVYTPYCCGGIYDSEVSWSVGGLSGGADNSCIGTAGSFTVEEEEVLDISITSCDLCPAGKASGSRASECVACDAGKFADVDGSDVCEE